jgi:hypothetical protein
MNMEICGRAQVMTECQMISIIFLGVRMNTTVSQQLVNRRVYCHPKEKSKVAASVSTSAYGLEPYDHVVRNLIRFLVGVKMLPLSQSMPLGPTQFHIQWVLGNLSSVPSGQGMNYTSVWAEV